TNINCSCTFVTTETVERYIVKPGEVVPALPHPMPNGQQSIPWM
ncbi:transcriptional regulator, partial [Salmonella enterica]|nr:transcriptional regulator [Salmonella enterica]